MAIFPHLEVEPKLQINDLTRLSGTKSIVSRGNDAIASVTIQPGDDESAVDVFDATLTKKVNEVWFLDWEFKTFNIDIDATRNIINFKEGTGSELTATITTGTYTLATLVTEIKTQMDTAGSFTYTVTVDNDDKITISTTDGRFSLLPTEGSSPNSILPHINIAPQVGNDDSIYGNIETVTTKQIRFLPKNITIVVGDGTTTESEVVVLNLFSVSGDHLFSNDGDLVTHDSNILNFVPDGRNSWLNEHRRSQEIIMATFRKAGIIDINAEPLTVANVVDIEEVRQWSVFMTLRRIMDNISNSNDDVFYRDARDYEQKEAEFSDIQFVRLDLDNDGRDEIGEGIHFGSARVVRI